MNIFHIFLAIVCVISITAGQILFKRLGVEIEIGGTLFSGKVIGMAFGALFIYSAASVLWVYILRFIPLSNAYFFMSLTFVFVPLAAYLFLGENVTPGVVVGAVLIVSGVLVAAKFG